MVVGRILSLAVKLALSVRPGLPHELGGDECAFP